MGCFHHVQARVTPKPRGQAAYKKVTAMPQPALTDLCSVCVLRELFMENWNMFSSWADPHRLPPLLTRDTIRK